MIIVPGKLLHLLLFWSARVHKPIDDIMSSIRQVKKFYFRNNKLQDTSVGHRAIGVGSLSVEKALGKFREHSHWCQEFRTLRAFAYS